MFKTASHNGVGSRHSFSELVFGSAAGVSPPFDVSPLQPTAGQPLAITISIAAPICSTAGVPDSTIIDISEKIVNITGYFTCSGGFVGVPPLQTIVASVDGLAGGSYTVNYLYRNRQDTSQPCDSAVLSATTSLTIAFGGTPNSNSGYLGHALARAGGRERRLVATGSRPHPLVAFGCLDF